MMEDKFDKKNINMQVVTTTKTLPEDKKKLQQLLLQLTEEKTERKFSDKYLDRENEKIKLLNGSEISLKNIWEIIVQNAQPYEPKFGKEFYREMCRLKGWNIKIAEEYFKPKEFADYTNEIIYGRFPNGILAALQIKNKFISIALRQYKHFQFLSPNGQLQLEGYIEDAIREMKTCNSWYEFRVRYFELYKIPYQIDAFKETK